MEILLNELFDLKIRYSLGSKAFLKLLDHNHLDDTYLFLIDHNRIDTILWVIEQKYVLEAEKICKYCITRDNLDCFKIFFRYIHKGFRNYIIELIDFYIEQSSNIDIINNILEDTYYGSNTYYFVSNAYRTEKYQLLDKYLLTSNLNFIDSLVYNEDLDILKYISEKMDIREHLSEVFSSACYNNSLEMVQWIIDITKIDVSRNNYEAFYSSMEGKKLKVAKFLFSLAAVPLDKRFLELCSECLKIKKIKFIDYLYSLYPSINLITLFKELLSIPSKKHVEWFIEKEPRFLNSLRMFRFSIFRDYTDIIYKYFQNPSFKPTKKELNNILINCCMSSEIETLELVKDHYKLDIKPILQKCLKIATIRNSPSLAKHFIQKYNAQITRKIMKYAIVHGVCDVIRWLYEQNKDIDLHCNNEWAMRCAGRNGNYLMMYDVYHLDCKADIHINNDSVLLETLKHHDGTNMLNLYDLIDEPYDIYRNDCFIFKECLKLDRRLAIEWLLEKDKRYDDVFLTEFPESNKYIKID